MKTPRAFSKTLFFMVLQKKKKKKERERADCAKKGRFNLKKKIIFHNYCIPLSSLL
jgi:uncharacterized protein YeeX (DUF496 family)